MKTDLSAATLSPREQRLVERKNRAVDTLSAQFSKNALALEEYERLVDYIQKAESERELTIIEKIVAENATYEGIEQPQSPQYAPSSFQDTKTNIGGAWSDIAFMASREISGTALAGNHRSFLSFLGNTEIQIEEGQLPKGKTFVNAVSLLGNTIIRVPPSIRVTLEAKAILGNATIERGTGIQEQYPSGCPELVITGGALLGNLVVEVRKPRGAF